MRSKINIMDKRPDITDEELERFKNFDALLNRHYRVLNEKQPVTWKIVTLAVVLVGCIALYWWMNNNPQPAVTQTLPVDSTTVHREVKENNADTTSSESARKEFINPERGRKPPKTVPGNQPSTRVKMDSITIEKSEPGVEIPPGVKDEPKVESPAKMEMVYVQAEPVSGYEALYAYFSKELIYPEAAIKDSIEGVLIVKFLINKEGKPEKIVTSGTLGALFDKEAIRLIEHMPLWKPATVNGQPIVSKLSMPVTFRLRNKK